jgi:urease accessory protein UreH
MRTILEIFYVRIMGDRVRFQRKQANLTDIEGIQGYRVYGRIYPLQDGMKTEHTKLLDCAQR